MNTHISGNPHDFDAQIFGAGKIPSGDELDLLYEWGFAEAYMLAVPDIRRYLLDAYAHGVMHSLAKGDYRWADRESVPGAAIDRLLADLLGGANPAGVLYHSWRYVDLLREAWSEASEDLRDHNLHQDAGKLIRLLALAYDLGHSADPGSAAATEVPAPLHA